MKENFEMGITDHEMGIPDNDMHRNQEDYKTDTDRKLGIEPARDPAAASKESVDQVDNSSNFVFSSFHDLNLFVILHLENKLMHARKKLYDRKGLPRFAEGWETSDTLELQIHLKQYRNYPRFTF